MNTLQRKHKIILIIVNIILLTVPFFIYEYSDIFYTILKIFTCLNAFYLSTQNKSKYIRNTLIAIAILFNPIFKASIIKELWLVLDFLIIIFYLYYLASFENFNIPLYILKIIKAIKNNVYVRKSISIIKETLKVILCVIIIAIILASAFDLFNSSFYLSNFLKKFFAFL